MKLPKNFSDFKVTYQALLGERIVTYELPGISHGGNLEVLGQFMELNRHVAYTKIEGLGTVSTVVSPIYESFCGSVFETMVFDHPEYGGDQYRYDTIEQAKKRHQELVDMLKHEAADRDLKIQKLIGE